jgi:hypothetical protein
VGANPGRGGGLPGCGAETARVHEYRERMAANVPVGGRRVLVRVRVRVRVRRIRCPVPDGQVQTFREQVPGVLDRYQRRVSTDGPGQHRGPRMTEPGPGATAGGAGPRGLPAYRAAGPAEDPRPEVTAPRVLGIDFALRRGPVCATVLTGAETGRRLATSPPRRLAARQWLRCGAGLRRMP